MAVISPEVTVKGIQKCCISNAVNKTDDICCGTAVKRMGMLGVSARKMKVLGRWRQVTPICKGRQKPTCIVKVYESNSTILFSRCFIFREVILDLDNHIFPWQTNFFEGHLRLELSCIWANYVVHPDRHLPKVKHWLIQVPQFYCCMHQDGNVPAAAHLQL